MGTDMNQRYSLEPIIFTLAIIAMHIRSLEKSWRVLGYITDLEVSSKAKRKMETLVKQRVGPPATMLL
jgi:hypothetical protein